MSTVRKAIASAAIVGATLAGGAFGASLFSSSAGAATTTPAVSGTAAATPAPTGPAHDPSLGGHVGPNGVKEVLLTGTDATKAKAAALAAVPGGTIERVENDAEGAPFEAHMTKADGTHVTVKMDSSFKVTSIETGR
jgi:hypothetical protein